MKIRTDFVTNSSSSSYITFVIENKKLASIFRKYEDSDFDFGIFELEVKKNKIRGTYHSDGFLYTSEIDERGLVSYLVDLLNSWSEELSNINEDYYGNNYYEELAQELAGNELEINDELVSADIMEALSVTDGDGSVYRHITIQNDEINSLVLDEETWKGDGDESLIEVIQEGMYSDELEEYAQKHGRLTTGNYPTKQKGIAGTGKYPQNARKIISLVNHLDEGQLSYLVKDLTGDGRETLSKKKDIGESVYLLCKKLDREERWLSNNSWDCYVYLMRVIARYNYLNRIGQYIADPGQIDFNEKQFFIQDSELNVDYTIRDQIGLLGGSVGAYLSKKTDYCVINDRFMDDKSQFDSKMFNALSLAVKGYGLRFITTSDLCGFFESKEQIEVGIHKSEKLEKKFQEPRIHAGTFTEAKSVFEELINTVDHINCENLSYITTFLDIAQENEVAYILTGLGAVEKRAMSRKVGLVIIANRATDGAKTQKTIELIAKYNHRPIIVTYDYFCTLVDKEKVTR